MKLGRNITESNLDTAGHTFDRGYVMRYAGPVCDRTEDVWQWLFKQKRRRD
ncbi:MAG: hypothetical protein ACYSWO_22175 [Planctomycetota bacterium]